jgi:predicted nucleotidyltransferase
LASSDVDLMAEFDNQRKMTLLDMVELESGLSDIQECSLSGDR